MSDGLYEDFVATRAEEKKAHHPEGDVEVEGRVVTEIQRSKKIELDRVRAHVCRGTGPSW